MRIAICCLLVMLIAAPAGAASVDEVRLTPQQQQFWDAFLAQERERLAHPTTDHACDAIDLLNNACRFDEALRAVHILLQRDHHNARALKLRAYILVISCSSRPPAESELPSIEAVERQRKLVESLTDR